METKDHYSNLRRTIRRKFHENFQSLKGRTAEAVDLVKKTISFLETRVSEMNESPNEVSSRSRPAVDSRTIKAVAPKKKVTSRKPVLLSETPKKKKMPLGSAAEQNRRQAHQSSVQKRSQGKRDHRPDKPSSSQR